MEHGGKDGIITFPINPGGVHSHLGAIATPAGFGIERFTLEAEESAAGILSVIDEATSKEAAHF